jgi:hypothetical protein
MSGNCHFPGAGRGNGLIAKQYQKMGNMPGPLIELTHFFLQAGLGERYKQRGSKQLFFIYRVFQAFFMIKTVKILVC